jgi:hypothetical protein
MYKAGGLALPVNLHPLITSRRGPNKLNSLSTIRTFKMPSIASLTAALAFVGAVAATPVELHKRKTFTVHQELRGTFAKNGALSMAKTFRKYNKEVPANVLAAAAAGPTGTAPAVPGDAYDSSYLSPVTIGNTTLQLDFDTGSADL